MNHMKYKIYNSYYKQDAYRYLRYLICIFVFNVRYIDLKLCFIMYNFIVMI